MKEIMRTAYDTQHERTARLSKRVPNHEREVGRLQALEDHNVSLGCKVVYAIQADSRCGF